MPAEAVAAAPALRSPQRLRVNVSWALAGQIAYAAAQCAMLVALAKLATTAMVGEFSLAFAVTAPVFMAGHMQMRALLGTDAGGAFRFDEYLALQRWTALAAVLVVAALTWALGYPAPVAAVILVVALAKAFESVTEVTFGLFQREESMDLFGKTLVVRGALSVAALLAGLLATGSTVGAVAGLFVVWAGMAIAADLRMAGRIADGERFAMLSAEGWRAALRRLVPRVPARGWALARMAAPMGAVSLLISLNASLPRYLVERSLGLGELGVFSAMSYVALLGNPVMLALGASIGPRMAREYASGQVRRYLTLLGGACAGAAVIGGGATLASLIAGEQILSILFQPEYAPGAPVFAWILGAAAITQVAQLVTYGATAARYLRVQIPLYGAATAATLGLGLAWIPRYGLMGAGYAALASSVVLLMGNLLVVAHAVSARRRA